MRPAEGPAIAWVAQRTFRPSNGRWGLGERGLGGADVALRRGTMGRVERWLPWGVGTRFGGIG